MARRFDYIFFAFIILLLLAGKFLPLPMNVSISLFGAAFMIAAAILVWQWWRSFTTGSIRMRGTVYNRETGPKAFELARWLSFAIGIFALACAGLIAYVLFAEPPV